MFVCLEWLKVLTSCIGLWRLIYCDAILPRAGLGNRLFPWARCRIFSYLHHGVCLILIFVGLKMLLQAFIVINIGISLAVIALILLASILLSLQRSPPNTGNTWCKTKSYIFMADRWNKTDLERSGYLWLPLTVNNGKVEIKMNWLLSIEIKKG